MNTKKLYIRLSAFLILGLLAGCDKSSPSSSGGTSAGPAKQFVIGISQCNLGEPWRVQMNSDIAAAAAKHPELKLIFKDAQNDTLQQRSQVEEFIGSKVDVLIISPKEA